MAVTHQKLGQDLVGELPDPYAMLDRYCLKRLVLTPDQWVTLTAVPQPITIKCVFSYRQIEKASFR